MVNYLDNSFLRSYIEALIFYVLLLGSSNYLYELKDLIAND